MQSIVVMDADAKRAQALGEELQNRNMRTLWAHDEAQALEVIRTRNVHALVCRENTDAWTFAAEVRKINRGLPVVICVPPDRFDPLRMEMLGPMTDVVMHEDELLLRLNLLLHRAQRAGTLQMQRGDIVIDRIAGLVQVGDERLLLPRKEMDLLWLFASHPDEIFTRRQLMDAVWGARCETDERTVDVHIKRLRGRLCGAQGFSIVTVRGKGYVGRSAQGEDGY